MFLTTNIHVCGCLFFLGFFIIYYSLLFLIFFFLLTVNRYASPLNHLNRRANFTSSWKEQLFLFSGTQISLENFHSRIFWNAPTGSPKSRFSRFSHVNLHLKCMHSIHTVILRPILTIVH